MDPSDPQDIDALLTPPPLPPGTLVPVDGLLERTVCLLRRRRLLRRLGSVGVLLAFYAAGWLSVLAVYPPTPEPPPIPRPQVPIPAPRTASDVELLASRQLDAPLYRHAADRYLEEGDPSSATRCYGTALDSGDHLDVAPSDSWLLMAIKQARQKELEACDR